MLNELAPELKNCEPGALLSEKLPHLKVVIRMGEDKTPGMFNFSEVCDMGEQAHSAQLAAIANTLDPEDVVNIQFTSGTTGNPKGATLTYTNILNNAYFNGQKMHFSKNDKLCIPVPLAKPVRSLLAVMADGENAKIRDAR